MNPRTLLRSALSPVVLIAITLSLAGCGDDISGTYADDVGIMTITFNDGTATVSAMGELGGSEKVPYKVDGDKITLTHDGEDLVLTRQEDGSLKSGGLGIVLKKKS